MCTNNLYVDRQKDEVIQWLLSEEGKNNKKAEMNNFIIFFAIYFTAHFLTQFSFPHARLSKKLRLWESEVCILCFIGRI